MTDDSESQWMAEHPSACDAPAACGKPDEDDSSGDWDDDWAEVPMLPEDFEVLRS